MQRGQFMTNYDASDVLIKFFKQFKDHKQLSFVESFNLTPKTNLANTIVVPADIVRDRKATTVELTFYIKDRNSTQVQARKSMTQLLSNNFNGWKHQKFLYKETEACDGTEVYIDFKLGQLVPQEFSGDNYIFTAQCLLCISKERKEVRKWEQMH